MITLTHLQFIIQDKNLKHLQNQLISWLNKFVLLFLGLKHQGIFRVPGASQEITDMKTAFEEGNAP